MDSRWLKKQGKLYLTTTKKEHKFMESFCVFFLYKQDGWQEYIFLNKK